MPEEDRSRPTSFAEAKAETQMRALEDTSKTAAWFDNYQDKLQDAADPAARQTENKGFWGNLLTIGTTVGCYLLDPAKGGTCALIGLGAGTAARTITDWGDPAEEAVPDEAVGPDVDYYRDKIPGLVNDLNNSKEKLDNFHANEWKRDVLLQLNDTMTAAKIGAGIGELGLFSAGEGAAAGDTVAMLSGSETNALDSIFEQSLFTEPPTNLT